MSRGVNMPQAIVACVGGDNHLIFYWSARISKFVKSLIFCKKLKNLHKIFFIK